MASFADRVQELRRVPASELRPHPRNWRTHPHSQRDVLHGLLSEIGFADALVVRELEDGSLQLIDGHLRAETADDALVPVLVVDLSAAEAEKLLLTHDPLASMAGTDTNILQELLAKTDFESQAITELLDKLATEATHLPFDITASQRPEIEIPECYQIVVECRDEAKQQALYERLRGEGLRCRVLTL